MRTRWLAASMAGAPMTRSFVLKSHEAGGVVTALLVAERWRNRFLQLAFDAGDQDVFYECVEAAYICERLRLALERRS